MANSYGFDPVAWSIDGGRHPGDLLRFVAYASTGGKEGIVSPGDCKVSALSTAGPQIQIAPGGVLIRNRSAGVRNQTYAANGRTVTTLDVGPQGASGGRSDLVVVRIEDPQYSPWPAVPVADRLTYQYVKPFVIPNVPAGTTDASKLNLGYSAYALARLDIPANTTNITSGMVKETRKLANPQQHIERVQGIPAQGQNLTATSFANWPTNTFTVPVPEWATYFYMRYTIGSYEITGDGGALGQLRAHLGDVQGVPQSFDFNGATIMNGARDSSILNVNDWCSHLQGQNVVVKTMGLKNNAEAGYIRTWVGTQQDVDIVFYERAV